MFSRMSSFLPSIDNVRKSSLVAAKQIYSAMDFLDESTHGRLQRKTKQGQKRNKRPKAPSPNGQQQDKVHERSKEYSSELRARKEKAKRAREESAAEQRRLKELRDKGLREKKRLNQLFSVYAAQQGPSYRNSARVVRPKFPTLLKHTKSTASREKVSYQSSPLPKLSSVSRMDEDSPE